MRRSAAPNAAGAWCSPGGFALLLALLLVAWFPAVCTGARTFFYRDFGVLAYPTVHYAREAFWRGELPLWNPLSHCGVPFLAQWGTMVLYPGALIYLLLPLPWSLNVFCLAHLWLAGYGLYHLARGWTGNPFAAGIAGVAFTFSGVSFSSLLWPNYTAALGWMPWVVLAAGRAGQEGRRALVVAAFAGALQLLTGVPEIIALTWLVVSVLALGGLVADPPGKPGRSWRLLTRPTAALALALALSAAQLLPFLDLWAHSQRIAASAASKWALPPWGWANLVAPLVHCYQTPPGVFFQQGQEFFSSVYMGAGVVMLAALAVLQSRSPRVWILGTLALLGIWLALGDRGLLLGWLAKVAPPVAWVRYPVKFLLLTAFVLPLLAAFALNDWLSAAESACGRGERRLLLVAAAVICLTAGVTWLAHKHPLPFDQPRAAAWNGATRAVFLAALVAPLLALRHLPPGAARMATSVAVPLLIWADFATHAPLQNPTLPARLLEPGLARLPQGPLPGEGRVFITPAAEAALLASRVAPCESDFVGKRLALWSNLNLLEGIAKVNGAATLRLREQAQVEQVLEQPDAAAYPAIEDFLGVRFRTSDSSVVDWAPRTTARPLVTAGQEPVFVSGDEALRSLTAPGFEPQRRVWLPAEARSVVELAGARHSVASACRVTDCRFSAHRLDFTVDAGVPGWAVIAQSYDHNWRAFVDDQPVPLWRANQAFQALAVPAGGHRVRLVYAVGSFRVGLGISALAVLVCAAMGWNRARGYTGGIGYERFMAELGGQNWRRIRSMLASTFSTYSFRPPGYGFSKKW